MVRFVDSFSATGDHKRLDFTLHLESIKLVNLETKKQINKWLAYLEVLIHAAKRVVARWG